MSELHRHFPILLCARFRGTSDAKLPANDDSRHGDLIETGMQETSSAARALVRSETQAGNIQVTIKTDMNEIKKPSPRRSYRDKYTMGQIFAGEQECAIIRDIGMYYL